MKLTSRATMYACFLGSISQAIINNFMPLMLVFFQSTYALPLSQATLLITCNFVIQLVVDMFAPRIVDFIGMRSATMLSHITAALGLILLTILPEVLPPFLGMVIAVCLYAVGGGLLEVLISPIMEACPSDNKEKAMSLLHSFYCWGHVGVVLLSTIYFGIFGIQNWKILACTWSLVPIFNTVLFSKVPLFPLIEEGETGLSLKGLVRSKIFWLFLLMMTCAGASEQAVSQWASAFAEQGLGVSKAIGDLAGPMAFAFLMGTSRLIFGKYGDKLNLNRFMTFSCILCVLCYMVIALVPIPAIGLIGCAVCGFSVGIFWPGTTSKAAAAIRNGGTTMFAMLALAGDLGCSAGPTLAGMVSSLFNNNLRMGVLAAAIFPMLLLFGILALRRDS